MLMILCSPTLRSWKLSMGAVEAIDDGTPINLIMEVALSLHRLLIHLYRIDDVYPCHLHLQHDLMFLAFFSRSIYDAESAGGCSAPVCIAASFWRCTPGCAPGSPSVRPGLPWAPAHRVRLSTMRLRMAIETLALIAMYLDDHQHPSASNGAERLRRGDLRRSTRG
jgi:hypothetical protein